MQVLAEQPLLISLMVGLIGGALLYGWTQTGKRAAAVLGLLFLLLVPVVWIVSSMMVTDREQIEAILYEAAAAVEANDHEAALKFISDPQAKAQAAQELPNYIFSLARVNRIRSIVMIDGSYPPQADVDMSVKVDVSSKRGGIRDIRVPRRLLLHFEKAPTISGKL
ncbi:putative membrane protein [Rhodopirellula maiorica SM1]|uniref:Putative membrane protein n=1 Tax=Rhodopirellula maiorica SM1 TaxID=1265738 RepID=M5RMT6_9BACT|nr:putative membrane protein [Rhodopirellula maiorica]EMI20638.1 putative membrane protein [Rhodopirellula maiorica SM1]